MSWFDKAIANAGVDKRDDYGEQAIEREQQAQQEAADYDTAWNYIKHGDIAGLSDYTDRNYNYRDIPFLGQIVGHASDAATQGIADFAQFVGAEGVGNYLNDAAQRGEEYLPPMSKPELSWNYISDPNGMASAFGSVAGSMLPIGAAAYLAPVGRLTAAAANAASKVPLMGGLLSASAPHAIRWGLTGPVEAAMEAGSGERDMREQGMSNEEARQKSWDIFGKNAALLAVTNAVEGAALPHIFKGITKAAQNGSRLAGAGRFAGAAATETGMNALEEGEQQGIQNSVTDKPYSINPLNWSDDQVEAAKFGVAGTLPFALAGLPATIRGMRRNDNPMQNDALEAAREAIEEQPTAEDMSAYIDEEPVDIPSAPTSSQGYMADGDNSLDGFDSRYISKWESVPGATDLENVRQSVKAAFNGLAAEYGDGLTITGGAEKGYHAGGADGHEGGWKLDVDKSSVKDKDSFLALCAKYGFKVGDEGDHYDLSANPNGGVGGQVVATPDTYAGSNGGQREGNENAWAVYDVFRGAGYSNEAIAGILGRVQQEHNFDTSDVPEHEEEGMHVGGYGMFQWNGGRTTAFKEWAEANNLDPQDARVQAQYALQEAQERGLTPEKMNQLSAEEAADLWTDEWEVGKRGNERQFANEWLGRIKSGGRSEASDINLPNYDDSSSNERGEQLAADQRSWDKVAERGREEENPEKPETQEELVKQAKERAVDAGDMDKTAEIVTAQRSGDTKKLAEIAEKERKAKAKEAKGKEAPKAPKIEQKTPVTDALRRRAQKANMAAQMNDDTTTMYQIARALSQNDGAEINRIADSLGIPDEVKPALASDEMVNKTRDIVEQARNAGIKFNEQNVMQTLAQRDDEQVNKLYNYAQKELAQIPSQTAQKAAESVPTAAQKETPAQAEKTPVQPKIAAAAETEQSAPQQYKNGVTAAQMQKAYADAMADVSRSKDERAKQGRALITVANGTDVKIPEALKVNLRNGVEGAIKRTQDIINQESGITPPVVENAGAEPNGQPTVSNTEQIQPAVAEQQPTKEETTQPQKHNTITDLQKAVKGTGRKALTKALEAGYKPVDGENAIESPEGERYYLSKSAADAFAKDYDAKQTKEIPAEEQPPKKEETDQKTAQPEKKLHRVRRGREEIEAVAKKYENGEITAKEAYSQVSAIAKEIATVPKDRLPNVTYIDGKMKLDLTDYGNRLIDETTVSKQEKPAETANTTVTNNDTEEVETNEQPRTGESTDGGHGDVESRGSGENEPEGTGEVSGRDGREGTPVRGDDGKEHSNESEPAGVRAGTELETPASERADKRGNQSEVSLTEAEAHPSPTETPGHNYEIKDTDVSTKSEKVRFKQNVDAIKLLKQLEADDRMPTPAEQEILGAYNGWGGLKDAFLDGNEMNKELRELLTDEEYKAARSTINDAFYTPPKIIRAIWEGVSHLGFKGGRVLDPSMGVGNFFGTMPRAMMDKSMLRGVEIDSLTSRLSKMLYPNAFVENKGFQKAEAADNFYDLVISNIPFGQNMIDGYQIHNYFFANGMDKVRPGGLMVYITSQGSLAGGKDAVRMRNYLDKQADLIAAYKLPSGVFSDAGTQVATDIVVFRKHDADGKKSPYAQKFTEVKPVESGSGFYTRKLYDINEYFDKHRENILGETSAGKDQWGNPSLNVKMAQGTTVADVAGDLENAMKKLPKDVYAPVNRKKAKAFDPTAASKRAMADEKTRDYEYYFKDGEPVQNQNGKETPLTGKKAKIVGDYIKLKNTLNALFAAESDPKAANKDVEGLRKRLNKDYDAFVAKHGQLTGAAASSFNDDPSAGMVQALEKPIEETYTDKRGNERKRVVGAEKADIFTTRSIKPVQEVTHVETADDALIASLTNRGGVDVDYMAKLMGSKPEQVISKLKGKLFQNPVTEEYETRDEYLSGNVREKLAQAKEAAKGNKAYENNVKELEKVIPEDLVSDEIYVNLGTPWIPVQDVQAFVDSVSDNITVKFSRGAALWNVSGWGSSAKYKLKGITFGELLDHVLNNKAIQIFDGKGEDKVFNQEKTDAANVAAEELQQDFRDWIWKDKERENRLVKYYNDNYNNMVVRQYDGQHLNLHNYGMNAKINLKPHQKDVVWRMLQGGNTLIAHCVGAGKTFEMQAAGMEMRRLGIANKPMYCLPNNVVQQFAREFRQLYPNAKLLVLQSNDLPAVEKTSRVEKTEDGRTKRVSLLEGKSEKQKAAIMAKRTARNRMLNRIRTEDWDGIIISHNLFQRFPVNPETAADFIQQEIDTLEQTIREAKQDKMDSRALSNLETSKKNLQERLEEVISTDIEDIGVPFEELGIDQLFVDEADMFKNLAFATRLGNIRGLSNSKANRSQDMFLKTQWLTNNMGGRGVVFATGTPVSNTMSELYTMMRYLDMNGLKEKGLEVFDNWMRTFGDIGQGIERKPTGDGFRKVTMIKRFINMAELTKMFRKFADVKVQDELNLDIPKLKNDKTTVVALDPDEKVVNYIKNVVPERVKKMKNGFKKEKGEDNMLSLTNDLRKLSLTDSKIEACADAIAKKYHDTTDVKGTQLVFCDMGIPKAENEKASGEGTATTFDVESPEVYRTLIAKLKEKGIPDKDVAFIQSYNTKAKRDEVFQKVNNGEVRILIGSTETMGAGTNCQTHLVALHDLDAPWRPRDLEQRHGRILRQGNENKEVEIFNYVVKDSFDANMWEKLKNKAAIIQQAMSGDMNMRTVEDADLVTLSYAEVEGAATGNPLIKEQLQVQNDLAKYQHAQTAFRKKVRDAENVLDGHEERIAEQEKVIGKIEKDIATRKDTSGDNFSMLVGNKGYKERAKAQEALDKILEVFNRHQAMDIGKIGGFRLSAVYDDVNGVKLQLVNNRAYRVQTNSVRGIENALQKAPDAALETRQSDLDSYKKEIAQAKEIVEQENPYAEKVKTLSDRLNQLNREIEATLVDDGKQKAAKAEDASIDSEPEVEAQETAKEETPKAEKEEQNTESAEKNLESDRIIVGTVPPAGKSTANVNVDEFKHTKTGEMIPAASLKDHVDKNFRKQATAIAKNHGGKWSPFAKRILFKTEEGRDDFVREVEALLSVTKPESGITAKLSAAWHGSPHDFDTFSLDHIGAGEGAQAHGWGLYFAKDKNVSEGYRDRLSDGTANKGKLFEVEIPDNDVLLDEQKPFNEQPKTVQDAIENIFFGEGPGKDSIDEYIEKMYFENPKPYKKIYDKYVKYKVLDDACKDHSKIDWLQYNKPTQNLPIEKFKTDFAALEKQRDMAKKAYEKGREEFRQEYDEKNAEIDKAHREKFKARREYFENKKDAKGIMEAMTSYLHMNSRQISEALNKYGVKGITYEGGRDGRCYVIFDDKAIKIINKFSAKGEMRRAIERATVVDNDDLTPQQRKMSEFGKEMGTPILWIDTNPNMHGYHVPDGTTVLNTRSNMPLSQVFWHESFHWIVNNNPEHYQELTSYFKGKDAFTSKQLEAYRKRIGRPEMSDELTIEEMLADNFEEVKNRVKIFKEMGAEQPSLARKFVAWVKRIMDKFAEFFHNPEGKLTTSQRDSFVKAFGRLARDMKDGNGRPLFKVYKEGKEIKLPDGKLVTDGVKLSMKNDVDKAEKVGDNETKESREFRERFDTVTQHMFAEKAYTNEDIAQTYHDVMAAMDKVADNIANAKTHEELDEIRDSLKPIRMRLMDYNIAESESSKEQAAIDLRVAREVFENANRGSEARSRVEKEAPPSHQRGRNTRAKQAARSRLHGGRGERIPESAYSLNGYLLVTPNNKKEANDYYVEMREGYVPKASANFNTTNEKHSEKGAFSSKGIKMSYSASDNSNESLFHKIQNMLGGRNNIDAEKFRYRKHLTEMLENALDVKIRYGKMDGKANVVYKENDKVLRSRHAYDWENILPFAGKLAAEKLGIKNPSEEMRNYIADWILTGAPNNVSKEAAQFHKAMQNNIPMATRLQDLQDAFAEWMGKDYREQMQGTIQWKNIKKTSWKERKEKLYEEWVEELEPINRLTKQVNAKLTAQGKSKLNEVTDPMIAFRLLRGQYGRTETMLEGENENAVNVLREVFPNVDFTNFKTLHMILKDIDAFQNTERQKDFVTYCTACHVMDMHQHNDDIRQEQQHLKNKIEKLGEDDKKEKEQLEKEIDALNNEIMPIPAAYTKENCQKYIDDGYNDFHDAQQDLVRFSNTTAAILADSGVISDKRYSELLNKWQNYVPLFRVFDDNEDIDFGDSMKHIKGSTRDIVNPLESIIRNTAKFMQRAESNKARQLLADVARCDASGWLIEEVDKSSDDKTTITFYENGKRKYLQTDPDIVRAVNNMGLDSSHMFIKFLHAITKLARACFTMASPEFALRNVARDWGDASLYTKHGWWLNPLDIARGFMHAWNKTDVYYEWLSSGAAQASALSLDRNYTQSTLDKMGRGYWKRLGSKDFFNALLEGLQKAGEYSEYGTRIAMYQKTKNAMLKENPHASKAEIRQAITAAAFESRDLMDFARHGKAGAEYNKITAFANASIQGWDKLYRSLDFKNDPKRATRVAAKLALYGILPAMTLFLLYHDDDWYKEAPDWLKETHWLFKFGDTIIRVPKANDMGIRFLANAVEKGMDEAFNKHPHKAKEYFMPMWDALPNLTPTSILPIMEIQANHIYFTDRPIIPQSQGKLPAKLQYGPYTTSFAKWIGEKFNVAPRNVEHFISGYLGTLGMALPKAIDLVTGEKQQSLSLEEMPLVRGYLYPQYKSPQSVNDFYKQLDEQTKLKNEYKLTHQKPEGFDPAKLQRLENAQKQLRKVNKQEKSIIDNPKWSLNDREVMQRNIQKKRIEIAKRALGQK